MLTRNEILDIVAEQMKEYEHPDEFHPMERAMSDGRAWQGHWRVRLYERVRERGYDSLTAFAEARPAVSLECWPKSLARTTSPGCRC